MPDEEKSEAAGKQLTLSISKQMTEISALLPSEKDFVTLWGKRSYRCVPARGRMDPLIRFSARVQLITFDQFIGPDQTPVSTMDRLRHLESSDKEHRRIDRIHPRNPASVKRSCGVCAS
ncbi:MAG TPA: hypothetical protein VLX61_00760 [Anaerolineales bacterium]|nr:hypothetical protein [Anaerolineales bacterium]